MATTLILGAVMASTLSLPHTFDTGLAVSRLIAPGRMPSLVDLVAAQLTTGRFQTPQEGDVLLGSGGAVVWRRVNATAEGFDQREYPGGYLLCTVDSPNERVAILHASGHGMAVVNGEWRMGDVHAYGYMNLPVLLRPGTNKFLFSAGRGQLQARISEPRAPLTLEMGDLTVPDILTSDRGEIQAGVVVSNATRSVQRDLVITADLAGRTARTSVPLIQPLSVRKVPVNIPVPTSPTPGEVTVNLTLRAAGTRYEAPLKLPVLEPHQIHRRTFISSMDGSLQYYAVNPAQRPGPDNALVLSLHGAAVEAISQARAYRSKDWLTLVAPTNRRPFGFNWEDWGKLDGMEVLDIAKARYPHDPSRVILTGHSMGGHGTWHVGLTRPDLWAAIGPAAGWVSFFPRGQRRPVEQDPVAEMVMQASNLSDTIAKVRNSLFYPIYVLHGDADDNVPVTEARIMRDAIQPFHPNFTYFEKPGGSHWWGDDSVDWPPMFEKFRTARRPHPSQVDRIEFVTAHPGYSSRCHWVEIIQQTVPLQFSGVNLQRTGTRVHGTTDNVATLTLDLALLSGLQTVELDGQTLPVGQARGKMVLRRQAGQWSVGRPVEAHEKRPGRTGPFKMAFNRRMLFVVGTRGTLAENAWAMAKARFDSEQWLYRGNGAVDIVTDVEATHEFARGRNVILYGNEDTNSAFGTFLRGSPISVRRSGIQVGGRSVGPRDAAILYVYAKSGDPEGLVAVVGGTTLRGKRVTDRLPYLAAANAYPDWTVFTPEVFTTGLQGVAAAGNFDNQWRFDPATSRFRD